MRVYLCGQRSFGAAALRMLLDLGHEVAGVSSPGARPDGTVDPLRRLARHEQVAWMPAGTLRADTLPPEVDVIVCAHAHDYLGRALRSAAKLGAIGYHPSLLPRHRGRDAVRWAVHLREPVTGGTIFWLGDSVDGGPIARQDWCHIRPNDTAAELWRRELFPMGIRLLAETLADVERGELVRIPQSETVATWEPSWERAPLFRPELPLLGEPPAGYTIKVTRPGEGEEEWPRPRSPHPSAAMG